MRLPETIRSRLNRWAARTMTRDPDFVIGDDYLLRWYVIPRNRLCNIYLHLFLRSDDDRALHDHPWASCSIILSGRYYEHVPLRRDRPAGRTRTYLRRSGDIAGRRPSAPHRIEIFPDESAVSLFLTGPKVREWGFWCKWGWRHWQVFTSPDDSGRVGRGCE